MGTKGLETKCGGIFSVFSGGILTKTRERFSGGILGKKGFGRGIQCWCVGFQFGEYFHFGGRVFTMERNAFSFNIWELNCATKKVVPFTKRRL